MIGPSLTRRVFFTYETAERAASRAEQKSGREVSIQELENGTFSIFFADGDGK
jgi:hypothetical protein